MEESKRMTGFASIDRPWLKFYKEELINTSLPECTMYQYIWESNKNNLSDVAFRYFGKKITFGTLFKNIIRAASALYSMGIRAGDMVTIMSMHTPETIYAIYALNYIGAIANMVYMTLSEKEILEIVRHTNSRMLLVLDVAINKVNLVKDGLENLPVIVLRVSDSMPTLVKTGYRLKEKPAKYLFPDWNSFVSNGNTEPPMAYDHSAPAIIVYTSGTTGEPKGVVLGNDNINAVVFQCRISGKDYKRRETFLNNIPPFFAYGISMIHLSISCGIDMTLHLVTTPEEIAKGIAKTKPNHYAGGPPIIDPLMRTVKGDMKWMLNFTGGGEAISPEKEKEFNQFLAEKGSPSKYCTGYGMSECCSVACLQQNHAYRFGSAGLPLPFTVVKIISIDTGEELQYGETGEICFASPNNMIGYYKNQAETDKIIEADTAGIRWLHTGDLGFVDEDGYVFCKGRIKRVYITAGKNGDIINKIFPQRIEECLETHPCVERCGVVVMPDAVQINTPIAYVYLKNTSMHNDDIEQELWKLCQSTLPEHLYPSDIYVIESMPLTASGKIDYRALEQMAEKKR